MSLVPNTITQMIRNFSRNKVICLKMDIGHSFYRVSVALMMPPLLARLLLPNGPILVVGIFASSCLIKRWATEVTSD